jgi:hypothetical protein
MCKLKSHDYVVCDSMLRYKFRSAASLCCCIYTGVRPRLLYNYFYQKLSLWKQIFHSCGILDTCENCFFRSRWELGRILSWYENENFLYCMFFSPQSQFITQTILSHRTKLYDRSFWYQTFFSEKFPWMNAFKTNYF